MQDILPTSLFLTSSEKAAHIFLAAKSSLKSLLVVGLCVQFSISSWILMRRILLLFANAVQQGLKACPLTFFE